MDQTLAFALAALAVGVLGVVWWLRRRAANPAVAASAERLDTVTAWPPEATRLMTRHEIVAFGILSRAFPEHMVLAQVPLARFLKVPRRNSYNEWLRRMGSQCADLVLCDMTSLVVAVVHVQPPAGQASERAQQRLARMSRVLKQAGIPLGVWTENALPSIETARDSLFRFIAASATPAAAPPPSAAAQAATPARRAVPNVPNPFEDDSRDSTHDERIEVREPPLSTWFDDIDSGPGRLPKSKP